MTGEFKRMDAGTSPEIGPLSNLPSQSFDWINATVSLLGLVLVGMFMATVTRMVMKAALGKPEKRPTLYGPKGEKLLSQARPELITVKEREIKNLRQAMKDWVKQYGKTPWSMEAKESFKLLKGRAKAIGLSDEEFENLWTAEMTKIESALEIEIGEKVNFEWDVGIPGELITKASGEVIEKRNESLLVRIEESSTPLFTIGKSYIIPRKYIKRYGERHSMWLTTEQRRDLEKKYGAVATRWGEEVAPVGDIEFAEKAAKGFYERMKEALGLGHLFPELSEEQIMKLREVLGLPKEVPPREKGYID